MELLKETKFEMPRLLHNFYQERASISHQDKLGFKQPSDRSVLLLTTLKSFCRAAESQTGPAACVESNLGKVFTPVFAEAGRWFLSLCGSLGWWAPGWNHSPLPGLWFYIRYCSPALQFWWGQKLKLTSPPTLYLSYFLCGPRNLELVLVFSREGLRIPGNQGLWEGRAGNSGCIGFGTARFW